MFKLVIAFVALATFQGVCGVPTTQQSAQAQPFPDLLTRLLGYPFKRQIDANAVVCDPTLPSSSAFDPLFQADTLLKRDSANAELELLDFPDVSGLLSSLLPDSSDSDAHGVLLKRLIEYITNEALESSDMLQERQFPSGIFRGLIPLSVQQALAKYQRSQAH